MINSVGRDIPEQVLKDTGMKVFQGSRARNAEEYVKAAPKVRAWIDPNESKMVANIHEALVKCGIKDGMTLGFHHFPQRRQGRQHGYGRSPQDGH
jgi:citrate lyase subunit alpha/citrate CoA-transferase